MRVWCQKAWQFFDSFVDTKQILVSVNLVCQSTVRMSHQAHGCTAWCSKSSQIRSEGFTERVKVSKPSRRNAERSVLDGQVPWYNAATERAREGGGRAW